MSRYTRVLRHRDFRHLFLGQAASVIGDRTVAVALALYVTQLTGSATDLGLVLAAGALPLIVLILFGGVFADRLPRQKIIVVSDLGRAVLHGVLAVLILTGSTRVWELIVIEALYGVGLAFFQPAYTGLMPQTVPEDEIQDAKALAETVANAAAMIGPAIATALVLGIGAGEAFAIDAGSFLFSAWMALPITPRARGEVSESSDSVVHELRAGWQEVRSRTWVWAIISAFTIAVLCEFATWNALAPLVARQRYGSLGVFGLVESTMGVGAVIGAVLAIRWRPRRPMYLGMLMILVWPVQGVLFALGVPAVLMGCMGVISGFCFSLFGIWWETALAQHIPPAAIGRVSAWDWMGSLALLPLGYVIAGPLGGALGDRLTLGAGSVIAFVALLLGALPRSVRALRFVETGAGRSAEQAPGELAVTVRGKAEVPHVDSLV